MSVQIAFYRGPPSTVSGWLAHIAIAIRSLSPITHCEVVIDGICFTSSGQDGGVRAKKIDLTDGRWEVFDIPDPLDQLKERVIRFYGTTRELKYGWMDIMTYMIPFVPPDRDKYICSEWVTEALGWGIVNTYKIKPSDLYKLVKDSYDPAM